MSDAGSLPRFSDPSRLAAVRAAVEAHVACDEREERARRRILAELAALPVQERFALSLLQPGRRVGPDAVPLRRCSS